MGEGHGIKVGRRPGEREGGREGGSENPESRCRRQTGPATGAGDLPVCNREAEGVF